MTREGRLRDTGLVRSGLRWVFLVSVGLLSLYVLVSAAAMLHAKRTAEDAALLVPKLQRIVLGTTTRADVDRLVACTPFTSNSATPNDACVTGVGNVPDLVNGVFHHVPSKWFGRAFTLLWPVYPTTFGADIFFMGDRVNEVVVYYDSSRAPLIRTEAFRRADGGLAVERLPWTIGPVVRVRYNQTDSAAMATAWDFQFSCFASLRGCERAEDLLPVTVNAQHCTGHYDPERGCMVQ